MQIGKRVEGSLHSVHRLSTCSKHTPNMIVLLDVDATIRQDNANMTFKGVVLRSFLRKSFQLQSHGMLHFRT